MDERKLTIIRGDTPDGGGGGESRTISGHTAIFIHKLVIFDIQYIVGGFNK